MRYFSEQDVEGLLTPDDSIAAVEAALGRSHRGEARAGDEAALPLDGGRLAVGASYDSELEVGAASVVTSFGHEGDRSVAAIVAGDRPELLAIVGIDRIRRLAAGAAVAVAATRLAKPGARSIGLIGCGALAAAVLGALRAAGRAREQVAAYCRDPGTLAAFCEDQRAEPVEYGRDVATCDLVVTATTSPDPVLRGEWLKEGSFVAAVGATAPGARELDNVVLRRSAFVCCDSLAGARRAADLSEPVEQGILDWLEVHELGEVMSGGLDGRQSERDIVLLKSTGTQTLVLALAHLAVARAGQ